MLVALLSVTSSGSTTSALALTATWPTPRPRPILVEADTNGGDLIGRLGLAGDVGLASAAADRGRIDQDGGGSVEALTPHLQDLPGGGRALVAPVSARETQAALDVVVDDLVFLGRRADTDILADCGRVGTPATAPRPGGELAALERLVRGADVVVIVSRPQLSALLRLDTRLAEMRAANRSLALLLCGAGAYRRTEVAEAYGIPVVGVLPDDPEGVAALHTADVPWRRLRRRPLLRAAASAAAELVGYQPLRWVAPVTAATEPAT